MDTVPDIKALNAHEPRFEILEAAAACFEERGFASTSIDDVARRLGSTKGRIYHHFSSKTDLFAAVFRAGMALNRGLQPLQSLAGSFFSSLFGGITGFAKGGVVPFASGGVVNTPTYFPLGSGTGLMGEAGAEAILPLQRSADGRLGVSAGGRSGRAPP